MMEGRLGDSDCWIAGWLGNHHHGAFIDTRGEDAVPGCSYVLVSELNCHSPMIILGIDISFYHLHQLLIVPSMRACTSIGS